MTENLYSWNLKRKGWHADARRKAGGKLCDCHIHGRPAKMARRLELAVIEEEAAWTEASALEDESAGRRAEEATLRVSEAKAALVAATTWTSNYDKMSESVDNLFAALMPCGRQSYPNYSVTGGGDFKAYDRRCTEGNCPRRFWSGGKQGCGWDRVYGVDCPIESNGEMTEWQKWAMRLRGVNAETGKPSYSPEFIPEHGTRAEMLKELRAKVAKVMPHDARDVMMTQAARVFDDRRCGRHLEGTKCAWAQHTSSKLTAEALGVVAVHTAEAFAAAMSMVPDAAANAAANAADAVIACGGGEAIAAQSGQAAAAAATKRLEGLAHSFRPLSMRAWARAAQASVSAEPSVSVEMATQIYERLRTIAVVTSDYASQLETKRKYTGTCASLERHNYLVSVVCYDPCKVNSLYKQHVDVFFAFHKAGFKPSARSFNVVQEDIDHWLRYGSMLHGEWFLNGERCPGGDHRLPLPEGLSERAPATPDFPGMTGRQDKFDGCPNQFAYGTNFHQIAEWLTKTAQWAPAEAATAVALASLVQTVAAAAHTAARFVRHNCFGVITEKPTPANATALSAAIASVSRAVCSGLHDEATRITCCARADLNAEAARIVLMCEGVFKASSADDAATLAAAIEAASTELTLAAAAAVSAAANLTVSAAGILRSSAKMVEYHGKGACDAQGNVPKFAVKDAISTGKLFDPGTRELVLHLAMNKQAPSIVKAKKAGWEAVGRFFWGYMNTDRFTKFIVPDATVNGFSNSKRQHEFHGGCEDRQQAEKNGRMQARPMWCVCKWCLLRNFDRCEMKVQMGGAMRSISTPLAAGVHERQPQLQSLEQWGDALDAGMLVAVRADRAEHYIEGVYWLALLLGPAFAAPSHLVHATSVFEEGWLIVEAQWYKLEQASGAAPRLPPLTPPHPPLLTPINTPASDPPP